MISIAIRVLKICILSVLEILMVKTTLGTLCKKSADFNYCIQNQALYNTILQGWIGNGFKKLFPLFTIPLAKKCLKSYLCG